jgi:hypothetical protein
VDDKELHRDGALVADSGGVDVAVDLDRCDELAVALDEMVGRSDEPTRRGDGVRIDDRIEGELLVDEDGRRMRGENPGRGDLEVAAGR